MTHLPPHVVAHQTPTREGLVSLRDMLQRALAAIDAELDETRPPASAPEPIPTPAEYIAAIRGGRPA